MYPSVQRFPLFKTRHFQNVFKPIEHYYDIWRLNYLAIFPYYINNIIFIERDLIKKHLI